MLDNPSSSQRTPQSAEQLIQPQLAPQQGQHTQQSVEPLTQPPQPQQDAQQRAQARSTQMPLVDIKKLEVGFTSNSNSNSSNISGSGNGSSDNALGPITWAVSGLDLTIYPNEIVALLGESGCGKSLTASAMMQLLPTNAVVKRHSQILYQQQDCLSLPENKMRALRGREIAMVFQEPMTALNPVLTIGQQIQEVLRAHGHEGKKAKTQRTIELLNAVGIPHPRRIIDEYPHQLSGGMKQRIVIALALAGEPKLLIADEPTTALDTTIQAQILSLIAGLNTQFAMSILFITHDLAVVRHFAHRIAVMYAGHIVEEATIDAFFAGPKHPYSQQLLQALPSLQKRDEILAVIPGHVPKLGDITTACRFAPRCLWAWEHCRVQAPRWTQLSASHAVRCHLWDETVQDKPLQSHPVTEESVSGRVDFLHAQQSHLTVDNLKIYYPIRKGLLKRQVGAVKAVDGVSFSLNPGKTVAIVGESGCGKTTLGKSLVQLIQPTGGEIHFDGLAYSQANREQRYQLHQAIQMIFQDPFSSMNPRMRVGEIIAEGMRNLLPTLTREQRQQRCLAVLDEVELPRDALNRYPHQFSGGQRQRIAIARALSVSPKIIVCDEPTSALDVSVQAKLLNLLRALQRQYHLAYLFVTHDIAVLGFMADEVCVMYMGRVVERGTTQEILTQAKHPYTQALLAAVPTIDAQGEQHFKTISGDAASPSAPPPGCHFHQRCRFAMPKCKTDYPDSTTISDTQTVHCHLYE